jgi:uncharacterized damage-inducible protein DinB
MPTVTVFTNSARSAKHGAGAYTAAVLELLGDADPLAVMDELPDALDELLAGVDEDTLRAPEEPGKWSVLQVLWHLADAELVHRYRLRRAVAQEDAIVGYDQDAWAERLRYADADRDEALSLIRTLRPSTLRWVRGLPSDELQRAGLHEERGRESVGHMIRLAAGHDLVHRNQIRRILGREDGRSDT